MTEEDKGIWSFVSIVGIILIIIILRWGRIWLR
jgi:hypothetical protein